jgi:phosphohistidine phosphatase
MGGRRPAIFRPADVISSMELILWRHAEAAPGEPDASRPLTEHGREQAELMARWLAPRLPRDLRMLVSPARRAQETARALGRSFETVEALAPGTDAATLIGAAGWPDAERPVLVVGHQPTLGEAASRLQGGRRSAAAIAVGALWWLRARSRKGRSEAELLLAIAPEILARENPDY